MWTEEEKCAVVIDNGSGNLKAGIAGEDAPHVWFPMFYGVPKTQEHKSSLDLQDHYVGDEALGKHDVLSLRRPCQRGVVTDWDAMQRVWQTVFHKLGVNPKEQPVILADPPLNPVSNREKMAQVMFEHFEVPAFYVITDCCLCLLASGRHMAVIIDVGDAVTRVMPIQGLYPHLEAVRRVDMGGFDLTCYLQELLENKGHSLEGYSGLETVRQIKESLCYVSESAETEHLRLQSSASGEDQLEKSYQLPDGNVIKVGEERYQVPEAMFNPALIGRQEPGIAQLVYDSITSVPKESQSDYFVNFVISGGSSLTRGFADRLQRELDVLLPDRKRKKVVAPPERAYSVWIGGSILASLSTFQQTYITRQQYLEYGPNVVRKHCQA